MRASDSHRTCLVDPASATNCPVCDQVHDSGNHRNGGVHRNRYINKVALRNRFFQGKDLIDQSECQRPFGTISMRNTNHFFYEPRIFEGQAERSANQPHTYYRNRIKHFAAFL